MTLDEYLTSTPEVQANLKLQYIDDLKSQVVRLRAQIEKTNLFIDKLEGKAVVDVPNVEA